MNQHYVNTSFAELLGVQNNQRHSHDLGTVSWGGEDSVIARFPKPFTERYFMRRSLDVLIPLSLHLSISSQYHVYLAFGMTYKIKKYSSYFENRRYCQDVSSSLQNSTLEIQGLSNQEVKPNWLRRNMLDGPVIWTGGWCIHPVRNHSNVFLVRSGNSVHLVSSNRKFRKILLTECASTSRKEVFLMSCFLFTSKTVPLCIPI